MLGISNAWAEAAIQTQTATEDRTLPFVKSPFDYFVTHVIGNISFELSIGILFVGLVALIMQIRAFKHTSPAPTPNDVLRITCVTLIITFSLALAAIFDADDLQKLTPIFGLFSTIAGYLLGSANRRTDTPPPKKDQSDLK